VGGLTIFTAAFSLSERMINVRCLAEICESKLICFVCLIADCGCAVLVLQKYLVRVQQYAKAGLERLGWIEARTVAKDAPPLRPPLLPPQTTTTNSSRPYCPVYCAVPYCTVPYRTILDWTGLDLTSPGLPRPPHDQISDAPFSTEDQTSPWRTALEIHGRCAVSCRLG